MWILPGKSVVIRDMRYKEMNCCSRVLQTVFLAALIAGVVTGVVTGVSVDVMPATSDTHNPPGSGIQNSYKGYHSIRMGDVIDRISSDSESGYEVISKNEVDSLSVRNKSGILAKILRMAYDDRNIKISARDGHSESSIREKNLNNAVGGSDNLILPRGLGYDAPRRGQFCGSMGNAARDYGYNVFPDNNYSNRQRRVFYDDDYTPYTSPAPFRRSQRAFRSPYGSNYMLPDRVFDAVQDLIEDSSMFYVTFLCQPKFGKFLCKLQCAKRDERMTGSCESGYCNCMLKWEKKMRKAMSKRFMAAMEGYDTDCSDYKKAKHCKRFCKALTPDKSFTGLCKNNHCQCVTYPKTPEKKKNACTKAIKQLKRIEDKALTHLGFRPRPLSAYEEKQLNVAAEETIQKLKSNNSMDGCTEEDIQNLRGIIANLSQGLNLVRDYSSSGTAPGTYSGTTTGTTS